MGLSMDSFVIWRCRVFKRLACIKAEHLKGWSCNHNNQSVNHETVRFCWSMYNRMQVDMTTFVLIAKSHWSVKSHFGCIFTNRPSLVVSCNVLTGISDHTKLRVFYQKFLLDTKIPVQGKNNAGTRPTMI